VTRGTYVPHPASVISPQMQASASASGSLKEGRGPLRFAVIGASHEQSFRMKSGVA